jgi:L-ribulose-5-phosphate 3-epimerase
VKLGIMQGRLVAPDGGRFQSFPRSRWRDEFALAAAAELDTIEWIYDAYGEDVNPLMTADGRLELSRLCRLHGVRIESVCADWFMDFPLTVNGPATDLRWARLGNLMDICGPMGIKRIVVPFVDASAIRNVDEETNVVAGLNALAPRLDRCAVELHLETSLNPAGFAELLERTAHSCVKVNYDSGNSASLGYRPQEEFRAYGSRVGSVHIKDRVSGGGTVPLGTGDTDFDELFAALATVRYAGDFILQVARGSDGHELAWTRQNVATARRLLRRLQS